MAENVQSSSATKVFKYKAIALLTQCPPLESVSKEIDAYRYTFDPITNSENFIPQVVKKPGRFNDKSDLEKCSGYGLSLYENEQKAVDYYAELAKTISNIKKLVGSHLAKGKLELNDGVCTDVDIHGHFDLHEYENADLSQKFSIIKPL